LWRGGVHLAQSFDTLGWIFRDLRDAPLLAEGLFGLRVPRETDFRGPNFQAPPNLQVKIGAIAPEFLHDCDANVLAAFASCKHSLAASGADVQSFDAAYWDAALSIYAPIQASEAAAIHAAATGGDYSCSPAPPGCENLSHFSKLEAGRDHTQTRPTILRYTTPLSLAGSPVVTLPFPNGAGIQLSAPRGQDSRLLTYAAALAT
jgi:aspartyl-tRNA(Asn)/glutamyl-tRNA(Gln) amidotransferase subunit A